MDRLARIFPSYEAAARADLAALAVLSPQERLDRALELHARYRETFGEAGQGFTRVARIVPRKGVEFLVRNKRATGRTQDLADAEFLEQLGN